MYHAAASFAIGSAVCLFFKSWTAGLISFLSGVFIDVDHLIDYFLKYGINVDVKNFFKSCYEFRFEKFFLIFHSYELIAALWAVVFLMPLGIYWKAAAAGLTQHVIFDQVTNSKYNGSGWKYFFIYRMMNKFGKEVFVKNGKTF